jgi:hypothetical protein
MADNRVSQGYVQGQCTATSSTEYLTELCRVAVPRVLPEPGSFYSLQTRYYSSMPAPAPPPNPKISLIKGRIISNQRCRANLTLHLPRLHRPPFLEAETKCAAIIEEIARISITHVLCNLYVSTLSCTATLELSLTPRTIQAGLSACGTHDHLMKESARSGLPTPLALFLSLEIRL